MAFKDHFSGHAGVYREARPTYPPALFDWLTAQAPRRTLAWDCGCGNGQATGELAARFERVFATDPSANQIAQAEPIANATFAVEPAEQCSLADTSTDLITVAQALHWFDHARFFAEAHRVLAPRGVFAAWGYSDCQIGVAAVDAVKDRLYVDLTGPYWPPERALVEAGFRTIAFPFDEIATPAFPMVVSWTVEHLLAYFRSWSATQRYIKAKGHDPVALVEPDLRAAWGDPAQRRDVRWQFHLRVGRIVD